MKENKRNFVDRWG